MERVKRAVSLVLCLAMVLGFLPVSAFAANADDALTAALSEAQSYIDGITVNSSSNDPETVVKNFETHFTWDNEKRESSKSYLFDWSYYNGVVFEGLEYLYEVTGNEDYKDYVLEYMSSLIAGDGTWAKCSNNSSKECAGYNATHGADCYKTASLLLDAYELSGDGRYLTMANTLYADLDSAAAKYSLSECGGNYRHTWASDPSPDLWLDGLYMILPFRAEYAKHVRDTEELDLIVSRMQWVSDNMYDSTKGLFYHAADSATSNSGTFWLRSIGWYAAAIVDVMDSMEGENLETMKAQLVKLVDGMKACQNASNGMWLNDLNSKQSSANPYETSGTALVCYAVMKAVNNGWLDESYADMALLAFKGICNEKLDGDNLTDICFKGNPGGSNSQFEDNEGKGVGPFIMLTAEVLEHVNKKANEPVIKTDDETGVSVEAVGITGLTVAPVAVEEMAETVAEAVAEVLTGTLVAYDITVEDFTEGSTAAVTVAIPEGVNADNFAVFYVPAEGDLKLMKGEAAEDGQTYTFYTTHFSTYVGGEIRAAAETGDSVSKTGNLPGGERVWYEYVTSLTNGKQYLIVSRNTAGNGTALGTDTNGNAVTVVTGNIINDKGNAAEWTATASGSSWNFHNGRGYLGYSRTSNRDGMYNVFTYALNPNASSVNWTFNNNRLTINLPGREGRVTGSLSNYADYYLKSGNTWSMGTSSANVYFYEKKTETLSGAAVTFSVAPGALDLMVDDIADLTTTITLSDGTAVSSSEIEWSTGDSGIATVEDGVVTAVAEGSTTITATLNSVNGTDLVDPIELQIPVTVQSKVVVSAVLTGNDPVTTKQNVEPDFSNIKLIVTYNDGSKGTITVDNGLVIEGYDVTKIGYDYATISYAGVEYGTVRVTVDGDPYAGKEEATVYPEYPADGAVRIDKTATEIDFENTGVVKVELDVAGITVKQGIDIVLIADISNSMAWSLENAGGNSDAERVPTGDQKTKLEIAMESASNFAEILLSDNTGNAVSDNTLSFVTFAGYDKELGHTADGNTYVDSLLEVFRRETSLDRVNVSFNGTYFTDNTTNYPIQVMNADGDVLVSGKNRGDTNYDYAFYQASQTIAQIKAENLAAGQEGREIYVVFMTDGAPSHYNHYTKNGDAVNRQDKVPVKSNFPNKGDNYDFSHSYESMDPWYTYFCGEANVYAKNVYDAVNGNMFAVGFDLSHGGFTVNSVLWQWDESELIPALEGLAYHADENKKIPVYATADADELISYYQQIATAIKFAGTNANVTDIVDSNFDLQLTQITGSASATTHGDLGFKPTIEVSAYELWTKEETTDSKLIGTRKTNADGTEVVDVLETITFNEDGTAAYSNLESGNIMTIESDGTVIIEAFYFTYTGTPEGEETFKWRLGNITEKEVVLSYYAYLTGTMEGTRPKGLYYTNEEAILEYVDINDMHATQIFPIPAVAWGGASTAYEFYLVNEQGEPCDRNGNVIPFANRIIITGPYFEELYLNQADEEIAKEIVAAYVLPAGYTLYDETAKYTVVTASGDIKGSLEISKPADGKAQTTILVSAVEPSYIQSRVAFGVIYNLIPDEAEFELIPDKIVIDYGLAITKDVGENNMEIEDTYTPSLVGFSKYYANIDPKQQFKNTSAIDNFKAAYGIFSIEDAENCVVRYTPTDFVNEVEKIFCVIKMYSDERNDTYYMVDTLTVIPATIVYYETDFADVFTTSADWGVVNDEVGKDGRPQDDGSVGIGNDYGFDSTYANDCFLSDGHSHFVHGQGISATTVAFTFTGTGFEIISRTGVEQGTIKVMVYDKDQELVKSVSVLNKSEGENQFELYQIPVVSINDLDYGTYTVNIGVMAGYKNETGNPAYDVLNRGDEFYFDAVRVFNPLEGNAEAHAVYAEDGEADPINLEIRQQVLNAGAFDSVDMTDEYAVDGAVFVDRGPDDTAVLATYEAIGPNNELYLAKNQGVAFRISDIRNPASIDIGAKSVTGAEAALNVILYDANEKQVSRIEGRPVATSTAQNYAVYDDEHSGVSGSAYMVIWNTGDGVLSLTDLKIAYRELIEEPAAVSFMVNRSVMRMAVAAVSEQPETPEEPEIPVVPEEPEVPEVTPNYDILSAEFTSSRFRILRTATMEVVTTQDVEYLRVTNLLGLNADASISNPVDNADGTRTWRVTVLPLLIGIHKYTVTGYGANGTSGASASNTIWVNLL